VYVEASTLLEPADAPEVFEQAPADGRQLSFDLVTPTGQRVTVSIRPRGRLSVAAEEALLAEARAVLCAMPPDVGG
jgi:hypothetical protein